MMVLAHSSLPSYLVQGVSLDTEFHLLFSIPQPTNPYIFFLTSPGLSWFLAFPHSRSRPGISSLTSFTFPTLPYPQIFPPDLLRCTWCTDGEELSSLSLVFLKEALFGPTTITTLFRPTSHFFCSLPYQSLPRKDPIDILYSRCIFPLAWQEINTFNGPAES